MKRITITLALIGFICIASCGDDPTKETETPMPPPMPPFQLPDNLYEITKVYDVGNNIDETDIRAELKFLTSANLADIEEARLVIVKSSESFTVEQIDGLVSGNFLTLSLSNTAKQIIKPASGSLKDSDGSTIGNGSYNVYVAILGKENSRQLSGPKNFVLADKPIYAGNYIGTWEDLGPPGPAKFPMSLRINDDYTGEMFYANATFTPFGGGSEDATCLMEVDGTTITSFALNQFIEGYNGGCPANEILTGQFIDDINLNLATFSWADCDGTRDVILKFTKQ
jgi:hypothetical protein